MSVSPFPDTLPGHADIAIVGAGFSGLAMAHRLREAGLHDFVILDRGDDVGGTWRDNTYPGCACDVPSHLYSLSFALNPDWSSTFSPQPEIQAYLRRVADDHGFRPYVHLGCDVQAAAWDDESGRWTLRTSRGDMTARVLLAAPGGLSEPSIPHLPGIERFRGATFHSATWDHDHDLTGERVAVVGTGASAIQFVPKIQPEVGRLHLFQRTPPWIMPRRARRITRLERLLYRRVPGAQRLMRDGIYWAREAFALPMLHAPLSRITRVLATRHMKSQISDPKLREQLIPTYAPGCKRILISNDYLPALGRENVDVVTDGIAEVRERSIVTRSGREIEVDTIIYGTGFKVTDFPIAERIRGRGGRALSDIWGSGGVEAHRGVSVAGMPNFFLLLGPNTGLGHTSVVFMAETQCDYVLEALQAMDARGARVTEVRREAQQAWNDWVQRKMKGTVWTSGGCKSWYLDERGRNVTLWPDFTFRFRRLLRDFDVASYDFDPARERERERELTPA